MRFVILHYHIFKNAGSTIEDILDHSLGERFGQLETPVGVGLISNSDLVNYLHERPGLQAFSSHQIRYPVPQVPGYLFFDICFLRDPLDRLRSFYDYFRQRPNPADPMSDLANRCNLGDFVAGMIRDHSLFVRNNQVNLLACGGDSDEPTEADLEVAIRRMKAMSFPGVVDCFEESARAGAAALAAAFPELDCARPAVNVTKGMQGTVAGRSAELRAACSAEVFEELLRMTELDRRLVENTRAEVMRRFEELSGRRGAPVAGVGESLRDQVEIRERRSRTGFVTAARRVFGLVRCRREWTGPGMTALFDANYYRASGSGGRWFPLLHFLMEGAYRGRQPHPLFDCAFYLKRNPDAARAGWNPLLHYLRHGAAEDRKPHPSFDPGYYRAACAGTLPPGELPLLHFLAARAAARSPHPLFDCPAYLASHPDVAAKNLNPLAHYLRFARMTDSPAGEFATGSAIPMVIGDLPLLVYALNSDPGVNVKISFGTALVWRDADGATHWRAEPQQLPLLRAVSFDQVQAQSITR
jgi:hypothetical protein